MPPSGWVVVHAPKQGYVVTPNSLADDNQPEGRELDMPCPECGATVFMAPIPPHVESPDSAGGGWLRCSRCDWEEKRFKKDDVSD